MTAPADGVVIASSTANADEDTPGDTVFCSITTGVSIDTHAMQQWDSPGNEGRFAQLTGVRGFDVTAGQELTVPLACGTGGGSGSATIRRSGLDRHLHPQPMDPVVARPDCRFRRLGLLSIGGGVDAPQEGVIAMGTDRRVFVVGMTGVLVGVLLVAMLPAVAAVVGDPLALGEVNKIDDRTDLKGEAKGANLQIKNTGNARALSAKADKIALLAKATSGPVAISAKASRNAVKIRVDDGQAPIKVNPSAGTATNLSADRLDGLDSTAFLQPSGLVAVHAGGDQLEEVTTTAEVVRSVSLTAPADGVVIVDSTATAAEGTPGDDVACSITTGTVIVEEFKQLWESAGVDGSIGQLAGTRGFDVSAGQELTFNLVCAHVGTDDSSFVGDSALTAIFIPNP